MFDIVDLYLCKHSFGAVFATDVLFVVAFGAVTIRQNKTRTRPNTNMYCTSIQ